MNWGDPYSPLFILITLNRIELARPLVAIIKSAMPNSATKVEVGVCPMILLPFQWKHLNGQINTWITY